jgi:hypothetical protein
MKDQNKYAVMLADYILNHCITLKALRAYQENKKAETAEAAISMIAEELIEMIEARTEYCESWLSFAELPEAYREQDELTDRALTIAYEGWRRGYIAGFQDRNNLE